MVKNKLIGILLVMVFFCGVICGISINPGVKAAENKLNLYISGPQKMVNMLEKGFEKEHGDVLNVYHTGCGPLRQKIWTEMIAGNIQADLVWGAEPIMYQALKDKGVLMQYKSPQLKNLKDDYTYGDGYYTAVNARYGVIVYNKERISRSEKPDFWCDLMNTKWQNKLVMADASQSAMALAITAGLYQIRNNNWDLHQALQFNNIMLTKQNVEAISRVESGEADLGIVPHDGVLRLIKKTKNNGLESPLAMIWPGEGAISVQRPIAIIKKERSPVNEKLLKAFVDFALSKKAQNISTKFGFITVRKDLNLPQGVPEEVNAITLDWNYASSHEGDLREGFKRIMFK